MKRPEGRPVAAIIMTQRTVHTFYRHCWPARFGQITDAAIGRPWLGEPG